jgi:hypothetical protein
MKDISDLRMQDHINNYDQIQKEMGILADEAVGAMNSVAFDKKSIKLAN